VYIAVAVVLTAVYAAEWLEEERRRRRLSTRQKRRFVV
jgi:hypothetical protein